MKKEKTNVCYTLSPEAKAGIKAEAERRDISASKLIDRIGRELYEKQEAENEKNNN